MSKHNTRAVILAAGRSTRFQRKQSKLLTHICGQPMILFPIKAIQKLGIPITIVLGHQAEEIKAEIARHGLSKIDYVEQKEQLGSGHAALCAKDKWDAENILILNGDVPLLSSDLLDKLLQKHIDDDSMVSFFSTYAFNPEGYGRVVEKNSLISIVEEKDCTDDERDVTKVNAGVYVVKKDLLLNVLNEINTDNAAGEFLLTDIVGLAGKKGLKVKSVLAPFDSVRGVNTLQQLWEVEQIERSYLIKYWMSRGVRFELAQNIHIDVDVKIGGGSFIGTGVHLLGKTEIGKECFVSAFTIIENTSVGDASVIRSHSVVQDSVIGKDTQVGPFARLRNGVIVKDNVTIGNFVELKKTIIGDSTKVKHLSYLGDTKLGNNVNVGAGTITCNYDGINKHETIVKDGAFVGSNSTILAPITIGENAYVAAGSTINKDVADDDLAIARSRQVNKGGYAKKLLKKKSKTEQKKTASYKTESVQKAFHFIGAVKTKSGSEENL
jgi:bifunctional UDP-N-acetylglucosamine pyrophosphorylase / glucosamine-1-phosphate N-acetyltransferase